MPNFQYRQRWIIGCSTPPHWSASCQRNIIVSLFVHQSYWLRFFLGGDCYFSSTYEAIGVVPPFISLYHIMYGMFTYIFILIIYNLYNYIIILHHLLYPLVCGSSAVWGTSMCVSTQPPCLSAFLAPCWRHLTESKPSSPWGMANTQRLVGVHGRFTVGFPVSPINQLDANLWKQDTAGLYNRRFAGNNLLQTAEISQQNPTEIVNRLHNLYCMQSLRKYAVFLPNYNI